MNRHNIARRIWDTLEDLRRSAIADGMDDEQARRWALLAAETYRRQTGRRYRSGRERAVKTVGRLCRSDTEQGRAILAKERAA